MAQVLQAADFLGVAAVTRTCQVFLSRSQGPGTVLGLEKKGREEEKVGGRCLICLWPLASDRCYH